MRIAAGGAGGLAAGNYTFLYGTMEVPLAFNGRKFTVDGAGYGTTKSGAVVTIVPAAE